MYKLIKAVFEAFACESAAVGGAFLALPGAGYGFVAFTKRLARLEQSFWSGEKVFFTALKGFARSG